MTLQPAHFIFRVELYTNHLLISGTYTLPLYRRLSDAINSEESPYIQLTDAIISPLDRPQHAQRVTELLVDRTNMLLITALHEPAPPPHYRPPVQGAPREITPIMVFTAAFALQAKFYRRPDLTLEEMLERMTDSFIPLKDVRVIPFSGSRSIGRDFACINRAHIQVLYAIAKAAPTEPGNEG